MSPPTPIETVADQLNVAWILVATILVRADVAICLLAHAEAFGLALRRMALRVRPTQAPPSSPKILH